MSSNSCMRLRCVEPLSEPMLLCFFTVLFCTPLEVVAEALFVVPLLVVCPGLPAVVSQYRIATYPALGVRASRARTALPSPPCSGAVPVLQGAAMTCSAAAAGGIPAPGGACACCSCSRCCASQYVHRAASASAASPCIYCTLLCGSPTTCWKKQLIEDERVRALDVVLPAIFDIILDIILDVAAARVLVQYSEERSV